MSGRLFNPEKGTWVLLSFITFFGVIVAVNTFFIMMALNTHSGVVTKQAYEKGLAYDETLEAARAQPSLYQQASFEDGVLRWVLRDESGRALSAEITARLVRPVDDGQDFEVDLAVVENGVYEIDLDLPMRGRWDALLKAEWNNKHYQTRFPFTAK